MQVSRMNPNVHISGASATRITCVCVCVCLPSDLPWLFDAPLDLTLSSNSKKFC